MALGLIALPFAGGCLQEAVSSSTTNSPPADPIASTNATVNVMAATNATPAEAYAPAGTNVTATAKEDVVEIPDVDIAEADYKPIQAPRLVPTNVRTNGPVGEIIRMSESGVDAGVLMAFVTNSTSIFSLSADEVIYLNDIGMPSEVVTAMLQHDQALRGSLPEVATPESAVVPATEVQQQAAAPAPNPADIAPQSTVAQPEQGAQPPPPAGTQVAQAAAQPVQQVNYNTFYTGLSPYGNWVYIQGYGQVWQPAVVVSNPSWEPYVDGGRWLYTDAGWYWTSDYSWGWAPFHYGRWFRHYRLGWCWYPEYVWSPAWVSWRWTDGYCGWAPLPPAACYRPGIGLTYWGHHVRVGFSFGLGYNCFTFVSWNNFCRPHHHHHRVDHHHAKSLYDHSVASHRFEGHGDRVRGHGPGPDRIAAATGKPVHRVSLRDAPGYGRGLRNESLARDGRTLTVYRPKIDAAGKGNRMPGMGESPGQAQSRTTSGHSLADRRVTTRPAPAPKSDTAVASNSKAWERPSPAISRLSGNNTVASTRPSRLSPADSKTTPTTRPYTSTSDVRRQTTSSSTVNRSTAGNGTVASPDKASGSTAQRNWPSRVTTQQKSTTTSGSTTINRQGSQVSRWERPQTTSPSSSTTAPQVGQSTARTPTRISPTANNTSRQTPATTAQQSPARSQIAPQQQANSLQRSTTVSPYAPQNRSTLQTPQAVQRGTIGSPNNNYYQAPAQRSFSAPAQTQRQIQTPSVSSTPAHSAPQRSLNSTPSYAAPQRSFNSAPAYSAPQRSVNSTPTRTYSAPTPSTPSQSYSAPQRSFSSPSSSPSSSSRSSGDSPSRSFGGSRGRDR